MKQNYTFKRMLSAVLLLLASTFAWAYDFEAKNADGVTIYYKFINGGTEAEVTYYNQWSASYFDEVIRIPETVVYEGNTYSVTSIGDGAFYNCKGLTSITIPEGVTSIGGAAFYGCNGLTSINIPNGVTSISDVAFYDCTGLTSINIPKSVTSIDIDAFLGCSGLTSMTVDEGNSVYDSRNNCNAIIESASNTLLCGCNNTIIPAGVTSIGIDAFLGCSGLTSVTIPEGVTSIGNYAFQNCNNLTSITIPGSVTSIGDAAFWGCGLTSVEIPSSVTSIGNEAFFRCSSLTSVTIPKGVTSIGELAFQDCSALTSIDIPEGVTSIGRQTFQNCNSLTSATIPEGVTNIGYAAFWGCGLTSVEIPSSVTSIGNEAFGACNSLTSVTIHEGVTSIGNYAFQSCKFTSVEIPNSVTSIGVGAFSGCNSLTSVTIPQGLTSIGDNVFYYCYSLTSVTIPEGVTSIGNRAFYSCQGLTSVTIPSSVTSIGDEAFYSCYSLSCVISFIEEPFAISSNTFWDYYGIYSTAILYCPNPELYKETDGWKEFVNIRPLEGEEEVTLAIDGDHYATFIAPFDVEIPANVEAYTVSGIKEDGETLQMDELTGTIPANTPVVLYSNDIVNETVTGTRTTQGLTYTYGLLTGVYTEIQAPLYSYVLQNQNDKVAFYYVNNSWNRPAVKANHAYLTVSEDNGVNAFYFGNDDDKTTGIQATVSGQESKAVIYDMTGRRVEKGVKGMYIIDGKKVMVK